MINSKKLFILAFGMTSFINMFANINQDQEETINLLNNYHEAVTTIITIEKNLQKIEIPENTNLSEIITDSMPTTTLERTPEQTPTTISLQKAQAFNIEGLELTEGTIFKFNGISYVIATNNHQTIENEVNIK